MRAAADLAHATPREARAEMRAGRWDRPTTGLCRGYLQANVAILPADVADEFQAVCEANPRPLPLLDVTDAGAPHPRRVAPEADLRSDVPRYRVYRDGRLDAEATDITGLWRDDLVGFLLGCSFTAEARLLDAGVRLRHLELGQSVPMWRTSIEVEPAGRFRGPMVVSMRPIRRDQLPLAERVTAELPLAHGAPVHAGDAREIGITDLAHPHWGDAIEPEPDEVPVFWACGVTPQALVLAARLPFAITHAPGHMFITDVRDTAVLNRPPDLSRLV